MKVIGIQIEGNEVILVVLEKKADGSIVQTDDCARFDIADHSDAIQVRQFRDQVNSTFKTINANRIGVRARNANAKPSKTVRPPSPVSFKLEGIIQLYDNANIEFIWPQTITAYKKKKSITTTPKYVYQQEAYDVAYYLINQ